ncbi:MAG: hypothetical protein JNJ71_19555 [Rubrivivax sp.]|nr:hypothetical protein [Rubrivivax sp.]
MSNLSTSLRASRSTAARALTGLALCASALLMAAPAQAQGTKFALTCIGTGTGGAINFSYRWGSGEWRSTTVQPGNWVVLSYRYDYEGENRAPRLQVRFDDDLSSGTNWWNQELKSYAAREKACEREGYTYSFEARRGSLSLVDTEGQGMASSRF